MNPLPSEALNPDQIAEKFLNTEPEIEVIPPHPSRSFRWQEHGYPNELARWHYHPEIEIHLIRKSTGSFIVGDYVGAFEPGHVAIVGSNLPHDWMSDLHIEKYFENRDAVIQFDADWLKRCSSTIPEVVSLKPLLEEAKKGIVFFGQTRTRAESLIEEIGKTKGIGQVHRLFALLELMANAPKSEKQYLSRPWLKESSSSEGRAAVESGIKYIFENLTKDIKMSEAARLAHMSEPTFSKYFKKSSGLTFSDMVRKLRIAHACRLLDQTDATISAIGRASGYGNLANFNRKFLVEMGMTPSAYRNLDSALRPEAKF